MNIFTGLMFLEGNIATRPSLDAVVPEWRRKPWRETWEEAAEHTPPTALRELPDDACVSCG